MEIKLNVPVNPTYHEVVNDYAKEWENNKESRYKEYREKWANNPRGFVLESAPLHLDIEPTNACNLLCPMCPRTVLIKNNKELDTQFRIGNMKWELYKKIIDEAADIGVYSIKLNWLGEPLLHPRIADMIKYAKDKGIVDVMLNTNAAILNKEMSKKLILAGLDKIFFSFDSPIPEHYESIRIGARFADTLNNIKQFVQVRNELGTSSPLTRVSMVLMEENKEEYGKFIDLFKPIVDVVAYVTYREPIGLVDIPELRYDFACSQLWQRMFVAWDGEVLVCCVDAEREFIAGNLNHESIKEVWKNEKYNFIRKNHEGNNWDKIIICKKCSLPYQGASDGSI